jgi:hypothetical protein
MAHHEALYPVGQVEKTTAASPIVVVMQGGP